MRHIPAIAAALAALIAFAPQAGPQCAAGTSPPERDLRAALAIQSPYEDGPPRVPCATVDNGPAEYRRAPDDLDAWIRDHASALVAVNIPVAFHVLYYTQAKTVVGVVTDEQILEQINVMNDTYAGTGLSFHLLSIDRTENRTWAKMASGSVREEEAKQALAIDPAHTLNVYTGHPSGALGWATFPWDYPESSTMHGVVVDYGLLPGGYITTRNEGIAVVHESGHYFGLFHTFQDGCSEPNDYCDDTPQEAFDLKAECVEEDSCPDDPGMDPIHNYMNYGPDSCRYEFTLDQTARMDWAVTTYRPSLL